ncbi:helix-turn-helix domain-containing protein [Thiomicrorhabdus lithotrophica]|uniref:Helix-turn-helix domain-containing protein n=1 Tax=Thiomicrorhabdus lithotrophica TaxID=2949997 RepID=A0ABY8C877_9GAMM|nr:helix-turn-helix domain-containing protein [Thiomicrorhabdus lithotrophica]WEJ62169.1 helix-turn-helix domain-containing protein [Thiomicrorhabdus lithotrophica]
MSEQGCLRKRVSPFAQTPMDLLISQNISLKAKGLYGFMVSKPDGWNFTIRSMASQLKDGVDSIRTALDELKNYGWIDYKKYANGSGVYTLNWVAFEHLHDEPNTENPNTENPNVGKPNRISKKDCTSKKDCYKKNKQKKPVAKAKFVAPTLEQVLEYATERNRQDLAKKFFDYYDTGSWKDAAGKAVRNWKQKFITWENSNPNQQNGGGYGNGNQSGGYAGETESQRIRRINAESTAYALKHGTKSTDDHF